MKRIFPIYYCKCCKKCRYRNQNKMKSLYDDEYLLYCADANGLEIITIIPKIFYIVNWCKLRKE